MFGTSIPEVIRTMKNANIQKYRTHKQKSQTNQRDMEMHIHFIRKDKFGYYQILGKHLMLWGKISWRKEASKENRAINLSTDEVSCHVRFLLCFKKAQKNTPRESLNSFHLRSLTFTSNPQFSQDFLTCWL